LQEIWDGRATYDDDWGWDASLGVQWTHAIAPGADIVLVESNTPTLPALASAVDQAVVGGAHVVEMSWGAPEFSEETGYDGHFHHPGVSFIAASGDWVSGVRYPAASPFVLGVGGTSLQLTEVGEVQSEGAWPGTGQGGSRYETMPVYQRGYLGRGGTGARLVPDVAFAADPNHGFPVLNSASRFSRAGWVRLGGTSAGAPQWAAIVALANQLRGRHPYLDSGSLLATLYRASRSARPPPTFREVLLRSATACRSCPANRVGFDPTTGLGSPIVDRLVPLLAAAAAPP
jgi:subtilase family serine protease